ncbi:MAG: hypothetical protein ACE5JO_05890 [Candidatus Binatia bacterium]
MIAPVICKTIIAVWTILCIGGLAYDLWSGQGRPDLYLQLREFGVDIGFLRDAATMSYILRVGTWLLLWNLLVVPTALIGLLFRKH